MPPATKLTAPELERALRDLPGWTLEEGCLYRKLEFRDFRETITFPGFWRLAAKHWDEGWREIVRSYSKLAFVRSLQRLIPEIAEQDIIPCAAGIRAQALRRDGSLVDDFLIVRGRNSLHVCNAPSPAATASLEIAKEIVQQIPELERRVVVA